MPKPRQTARATFGSNSVKTSRAISISYFQGARRWEMLQEVGTLATFVLHRTTSTIVQQTNLFQLMAFTRLLKTFRAALKYNGNLLKNNQQDSFSEICHQWALRCWYPCDMPLINIQNAADFKQKWSNKDKKIRKTHIRCIEKINYIKPKQFHGAYFWEFQYAGHQH